MTKFSLRSIPAAMVMTTAMAWGMSAQAAGLGVGLAAGAGANVGAAGVSVGANADIGAETRARALTQNQQPQAEANSRGATATSAVTDAKSSGQTGIGAEVSGAVSADGKATADSARSTGGRAVRATGKAPDKAAERARNGLGGVDASAGAQTQGQAGAKTQ